MHKSWTPNNILLRSFSILFGGYFHVYLEPIYCVSILPPWGLSMSCLWNNFLDINWKNIQLHQQCICGHNCWIFFDLALFHHPFLCIRRREFWLVRSTLRLDLVSCPHHQLIPRLDWKLSQIWVQKDLLELAFGFCTYCGPNAANCGFSCTVDGHFIHYHYRKPSGKFGSLLCGSRSVLNCRNCLYRSFYSFDGKILSPSI